MKKIIAILLSVLLFLALVACGSSNYLSWKYSDYQSASADEKASCTKAYIVATLEANNEEQFTDEEMELYSSVIQTVLEEKLAASPENSVEDIIKLDMVAE